MAPAATLSSSIPPEDLAVYRATARTQVQARRTALAHRRARALDVARRCADALRSDFGVTRVVVFGSLAREALFDERSDIDLAVWGLTGQDYWCAMAMLLHLDPEFDIDLVMIEDAPPRLRQHVDSEGVDL